MFAHYFDFVTTQRGKIRTDEPQGFDKVGFVLKQDDGRKGRDVSSSGNAEAKYTMPARYLERYGYAYEYFKLEFNLFGDQANIVYYQNDLPIGNVDMSTFKLYAEKVEFVIIALSSESDFKTTLELPTNLFSPTDLKGNPIQQCIPAKIFVPAKPILSTSMWESTADGQPLFIRGASQAPGFFNTIKNITTSEITATLAGGLLDANLPTQGTNNYPSALTYFKIIEAQSNLKNVKAVLDLHIKTENTNNIEGIFSVRGVFGKGRNDDDQQDFANAVNPRVSTIFYDTGLMGTGYSQVYEIDTQLTINLPDLLRGEVLYFVFFHSATNNNELILSKNTIYKSKLKITASETTYNSVIKGVRYIDAIKYAVKSAAMLETSAPIYEIGSENYNQFITNAQLMRGIENRPFYVNNKQIIEHIRNEVNGDFEVTPFRSVFYGIYRDYYRNERMGIYGRDVRFDDYTERNPRTSFNTFKIEYKNYAAQKEIENGNTFDTVHGTKIDKTPKERVDGSREVSIEPIRDPILTQQSISKAIEIKDTTATQDDDKIFMIDCIPNTNGISLSENVYLQHRGTGDGDNRGNTLYLRNDNSFSWVSLGVDFFSSFVINTPENRGTYIISDVSPQELRMYRTDGVDTNSYENNYTSFTYTITESNVPYKARTNEGFEVFTNLDPVGAINSRFTLAQNIHNYYREELATNRLRNLNIPIRNASYQYNPDATLKYEDGEVIREGGDYSPTGAIISDNLVYLKLVMNLPTYQDLVYKQRTIRGYIETVSKDGLPLKGYIQSIEWQPVRKSVEDLEQYDGVAEVILQEKYTEFDITIFSDGNVIIINEVNQPVSIEWSIDGLGYVTFYDITGMQLEVKVYYNRIKINNSPAASNPVELGMWLSQVLPDRV